MLHKFPQCPTGIYSTDLLKCLTKLAATTLITFYTYKLLQISVTQPLNTTGFQLIQQASTQAVRPSSFDTLLLAAVIFVISLESYFYPFGLDQGIHALIGFAMGQGQIPYLDVYNIKPPLTTLIHWLSQMAFGHSVRSIRILDFLICFVTASLLARFTCALLASRIAGLFAGIAFATFCYGHNFWATAQTDGWTSLFVTSSVLLFFSAAQHQDTGSRDKKMFAAGAFLACALLLKYTVVMAGIGLFAAQLLSTWEWRRTWRDGIFFSIGGTTVVAFVSMLMASFGALLPFIEIQTYILSYVADSKWETDILLKRLLDLWMIAPAITTLTLIGAASIVASLHSKTKDRNQRLFLLLWVMAGLFSGYIQGKGFAYHFLPTLPGLSLLAAFGAMTVASITQNLLPRTSKAGTMTILLAAGITLSGTLPSLARTALAFDADPLASGNYYDRFESYNYSPRDNLGVAEYVANNSHTDETLFLWGYETGVYFMAEKLPTSRFIYTWPLIVSYAKGAYQNDLMTQLGTQPPELFIVQHQDEAEIVTGHDMDSAKTLEAFSALKAFKEANYRFETSIGRFDVYRLNAD